MIRLGKERCDLHDDVPTDPSVGQSIIPLLSAELLETRAKLGEMQRACSRHRVLLLLVIGVAVLSHAASVVAQ